MIDLAKVDPQGDTLTPEVIKQNIKLPADLQEAYDRVVIAGQKIIFDEKTNKLVLDAIKGEGSLGIRLGKGIATLMLLLYRESQYCEVSQSGRLHFCDISGKYEERA